MKFLSRGIALPGVAGQAAAEHVIGSRAQPAIAPRPRHIHAAGQAPGQQFVSNRGQGEDVAALIERQAVPLLRRAVVDAALGQP